MHFCGKVRWLPEVAAYSTLDAQVSFKFPKLGSSLKIRRREYLQSALSAICRRTNDWCVILRGDYGGRSFKEIIFNGRKKRKNIFRLVLIVTVLLYCGCMHSFGQTKTTEHFNQVWLGYFNQTRFSKNWGLWVDLHLRTKEEFFKDLFQSILRIGLTYYINDDAKLTAGYAYVTTYPGDNHKNISQPEHRPWQQFQWHSRFPKLRVMQRVRLEERFRRKILNDDELAEGYNFNFRVRYNFLIQVPLTKRLFEKGTVAFVANDEVQINIGKNIVYNYFDQNRLFLGFSYQLNKHDNLHFGYMYQFQQLAAGNQYKSVNAARIFYFQNLNL